MCFSGNDGLYQHGPFFENLTTGTRCKPQLLFSCKVTVTSGIMKFSEQKVYFPFKSWIHDQAFIKQSQEEMIGFMNIPHWKWKVFGIIKVNPEFCKPSAAVKYNNENLVIQHVFIILVLVNCSVLMKLQFSNWILWTWNQRSKYLK